MVSLASDPVFYLASLNNRKDPGNLPGPIQSKWVSWGTTRTDENHTFVPQSKKLIAILAILSEATIRITIPEQEINC